MNNIDKAVGARIRAYRKALGMSQTELAESIGVRFQQVQKYEKGSNRVAASRLWQIADALGIRVAELFEEFADARTPSSAEAIKLFDQLSVDRKIQALDYLRALKQEEAPAVLTETR